jgi:hypothetical protein
VIGRRNQPKTSLLILRNEDGTLERRRVPDRQVAGVLGELGDRVMSVHDSTGKALYSQGAWPESLASDAVARAATEPLHQPEPVPPVVSRAMDRETEPSHLAVPKSEAVMPSMAGHDAFATGHGYATVADPSRLEDSSVQVRGFKGSGSGAVIGPDQVLTASHVGEAFGAPPTIADDPTRDVAVVEQDTGDAPALPLATHAPAIGQEVTILSRKVGGAQTANVIQTGEQVHLDTDVPGGTSGAAVVDAHGQIVSTITHGDDEAGTCRGPSALAIRESIAVPKPERTAGQPQPGTQIPIDDDALAASHAPELSR